MVHFELHSKVQLRKCECLELAFQERALRCLGLLVTQVLIVHVVVPACRRRPPPLLSLVDWRREGVVQVVKQHKDLAVVVVVRRVVDGVVGAAHHRLGVACTRSSDSIHI